MIQVNSKQDINQVILTGSPEKMISAEYYFQDSINDKLELPQQVIANINRHRVYSYPVAYPVIIPGFLLALI